MQVTRIYESPRVTQALHRRRSGGRSWRSATRSTPSSQRQDVRLTMGGEPTFVSVDDRDGAEWNIDALGPTKRGFATELVHRLRAKYGAGRLPALRPGQVVPGRAAAALGADHLLARRRPALLARPVAVRRRARGRTATPRDDAQAFIGALTRRLGLDPKYVQPGLRGHLVLPVARAPAAGERRPLRLAARRRDGARAAAPHLHAGPGQRGRLPAAAEARMASTGTAGPDWITGAWFLRDERLYLMPGDSPMGYRLPLDSLPWAKAGDQQQLITQDPFAARCARCRSAALRAQFAAGAATTRTMSAAALPKAARGAAGAALAAGRTARPAWAAAGPGVGRAAGGPGAAPARDARRRATRTPCPAATNRPAG